VRGYYHDCKDRDKNSEQQQKYSILLIWRRHGWLFLPRQMSAFLPLRHLMYIKKKYYESFFLNGFLNTRFFLKLFGFFDSGS
jgi:hypothetical protein